MLKAFDRGIDFANANVDFADAKRQGASFIMRYSAGAASAVGHPSHDAVKWKLCGLNEISAAVNAGLDFIANSEWTEDRVVQGYAAGHEDGVVDLAFWKSRGLNPGAAIYYSWDKSQPDPAKHGALSEYFRGVADAFAGYYTIGLYAGNVAIAAMFASNRIQYGWLAMSASWSGPLFLRYEPGSEWLSAAQRIAPLTKACIWQNGNRWYGGEADEDVILQVPVGSHLTAPGSPVVVPVNNPVTRPAPGPLLLFPLPSGYFFGPKDGPSQSVSGYFGRVFQGKTDREWLQIWTNQLIARGWSIGKGRKYLTTYGNDGIYGPEYEALIKAFQSDQNLHVDGELGVFTWNAAYHNPIS